MRIYQQASYILFKNFVLIFTLDDQKLPLTDQINICNSEIDDLTAIFMRLQAALKASLLPVEL